MTFIGFCFNSSRLPYLPSVNTYTDNQLLSWIPDSMLIIYDSHSKTVFRLIIHDIASLHIPTTSHWHSSPLCHVWRIWHAAAAHYNVDITIMHGHILPIFTSWSQIKWEACKCCSCSIQFMDHLLSPISCHIILLAASSSCKAIHHLIHKIELLIHPVIY